MNARADTAVGATRVCPHCKATVLVSSAICPGCQHHLRFNAAGTAAGTAGYPALQFEGAFRHPVAAEACEYCVVLAVTNERGEKIARQVISVGALQPAEGRSISLSVELTPARSPSAHRQGK
jgi:hypothetical protein